MAPVAKCAAQLFVGAFTLLNITLSRGGQTIPDTSYGKHPTGVIAYTSSGYMETLVTATDPDLAPKDLTLPVNASQPDSEWAKIGKYNLGYTGPYHINETLGVIVHGPLISATLPAYVGGLQYRNYTFSADGKYLTLSADVGQGAVDSLLYERLG